MGCPCGCVGVGGERDVERRQLQAQANVYGGVDRRPWRVAVVAALPTNVSKFTITGALSGLSPVHVDALAVGAIVSSYSIAYKNTRVQGGVYSVGACMSAALASVCLCTFS